MLRSRNIYSCVARKGRGPLRKTAPYPEFLPKSETFLIGLKTQSNCQTFCTYRCSIKDTIIYLSNNMRKITLSRCHFYGQTGQIFRLIGGPLLKIQEYCYFLLLFNNSFHMIPHMTHIITITIRDRPQSLILGRGKKGRGPSKMAHY